MPTPSQQDRKAAQGLIAQYGRDMSRAYYRRQWEKVAELVTKMAHLHRYLDGKLKRFPEPKRVHKAMSRITPVPRRPAPRRKTTRRRRAGQRPEPSWSR